MTNAELRKKLRQIRQKTSLHSQKSASLNLFKKISTLPDFNKAKKISLYLANDGEIDPYHILCFALNQNKQCYLPVINKQSNQQMTFQFYDKNTTLTKNKYGIKEPILNKRLSIIPKSLDMMLIPLVAFDVFCNRIGMGKGFFDRMLIFKNLPTTSHENSKNKPVLVGLAHDFQKVNNLDINQWDVQMDYIVTDKKIYNQI